MDLDNPVPAYLDSDMLVFATPIYYFLRFKEYFDHTLPMKL